MSTKSQGGSRGYDVSGGEALDARWWLYKPEEPGPEPHQIVKQNISRIRSSQRDRETADLLHYSLYGGSPAMGFGVQSYAAVPAQLNAPLSVNIVRSVIDTLTSRVVKMKPKATFLTSGGDYNLQQEAKKAEKYTEGLFYEHNVYKLNRQIVRDALTFGWGGVHGFEADKGVGIERAFTPEIWADYAESKYGDPRTIYHWVTMDKQVLTELYPDYAEEIRKASPSSYDHWSTFLRTDNNGQVDVFRSWHKASGPGAKDGRFIVCIDGATLEYGDFDGEDFPYRFLRYGEPILGWYGTALAQMLVGKQLEINKLLTEIQLAFHLGSNFRVLVQRGSKIINSHFNNEIGGILEYEGIAPVIAAAQTVHPEKFQHLIWLIQQAFQEAGVSQMSASGQKDPTLKSGKAQLVAMDVEDSRYTDFVQGYEEFCLEEAKLMLEIAREIGTSPVMWVGKKLSERLDIKDFDLKKDQYTLKVFPTSALASAPAQRMEQVQNLANAGWITASDAKRMLDFPELESYADLDPENASYELVHKTLDAILEDGKYLAPLPLMNLEVAARVSTGYYLHARATYKDVPPEHLALVLQFQDECVNMINAANAPPPQAPAPDGGQPPPPDQAPPGAPPPQAPPQPMAA